MRYVKYAIEDGAPLSRGMRLRPSAREDGRPRAVRDGEWTFSSLAPDRRGEWEFYARYRSARKAFADDASARCGTMVQVR